MTMRKLIVLYLLAFLFQFSVVNLASVGGVTPHLVFCLTVTITFVYEEGYRCIPFGIAAMLLADTVGAQYVGIGALALFITAIFVIVIRKQLNVEQWAPLVVTGVFTTLIYNVLYWAFLSLGGHTMSILQLFKGQWLYILFNTAVICILFMFMSRSLKKREVRRYDV